MEWNSQQDAALKSIDNWVSDPGGQQVFRVFGYAGTGKTTLARHAAEYVDGLVLFGAPTGKSAHVLKSKGAENAKTLHSMVYNPKDKTRARLRKLESELADVMAEIREECSGADDVQRAIDNSREVYNIRSHVAEERVDLSKPTFLLNPESEVQHADLVVIDEGSMVDNQIGTDLLSFGTKVLILGDPAQLPPVKGHGFFTEGVEPDVMLTEIHRQAADNPIIAMATRVRNREVLPLGDYGESKVITKGQLTQDEIMEADQILVGRNKTRNASNRRYRVLCGREGELPNVGEKLVCLRNDHEYGLMNGAIWFVEGAEAQEDNVDRMYLSVAPEGGGDSVVCEAHTHHFMGREKFLTWWERKDAQEFTYGYALTVHKAQGSQWDHTVAFDESWCFREEKWRHLYTQLTRAAVRTTLVRT